MSGVLELNADAGNALRRSVGNVVRDRRLTDGRQLAPPVDLDAPVSGSSEAVQRPRILLLEPHTLTAQLVTATLRHLDLEGGSPEIRIVDDVDAALDLIAAWRPALLICEVRLAHLAPHRLLSSLPGLPGGADLRCLVLSALPPAIGDELIEAGAHAFVAKPFAPERLAETVKRLLPDSEPPDTPDSTPESAA